MMAHDINWGNLKLLKHFRSPRFKWMALAVLFAMADMLVFVGCLTGWLWAENTRCASITGILGIAALCVAAWHGLIYAAQHKGGL